MRMGKSASGSNPNVIGGAPASTYQPTQQAQAQFAGGVATPQPDTAQQLAQIGGTASPALSTMVNQQMAPQGSTGAAPNTMNPPAGFSTDPVTGQQSYNNPNYDYSQPTGMMPAGPGPIQLPGGQQLNLNPPAAVAQPIMTGPFGGALGLGNPPQTTQQILNAAPRTGPAPQAPAPVARTPIMPAQPVRQQAPAPMPTRATQGYTSRTAPLRRTK